MYYVMVMLNGIYILKVFDVLMFWVKVVVTIVAVSLGFMIGLEGLLVYVGVVIVM